MRGFISQVDAEIYDSIIGPAAEMVTPSIWALFEAEIANEQQGGISPATVDSAIDSMWQADGILDEGWNRTDYIKLLRIVVFVGGETELQDLLDGR